VIPRSADPGSTAMIAVTDVLGDLHTVRVDPGAVTRTHPFPEKRMSTKKSLAIRGIPASLQAMLDGYDLKLVRPGHEFTGRERESRDRSHRPRRGRYREPETEKYRTGFGEPVKWLTAEEAEADSVFFEAIFNLIHNYELPEGADRPTRVAALFKAYAATPDDFPGLWEHYPEMAAEFDAAAQ
jgi:hypothetical protein